jgi:hypothetical protein
MRKVSDSTTETKVLNPDLPSEEVGVVAKGVWKQDKHFCFLYRHIWARTKISCRTLCQSQIK